MDVWYFGTDPALDHMPVRHVPLHVLPIERPEDVRRQLHGRYLAVGTTVLYGYGFTEAHRLSAQYLRQLQPVDRTTTFLIFDMGQEAEGVAQGALRERTPQ